MQARTVDSHPGPEPLKQAGYSLTTALIWRVTEPTHRAMVAISLSGFALSAGLIYLLARRLHLSRFAALILVGFVAVNPPIVALGTAALPESLFLFLFLVSILLVLKPTTSRLVACGVCHVALLLMKGHAIIYVPTFLGYLLGVGRNRIRLAMAYAMSFVIVLYAASYVLPSGSVTFFQQAQGYAHGLLIGTDLAQSQGRGYFETAPLEPTRYIAAHPVEYGEKYLRMVSRTKTVLTSLGGPAVGSAVPPLLFLSIFFVLMDVLFPGVWFQVRRRDPPQPSPSWERRATHILFPAVIGVTLVFFWAVDIRVRYLVHVYPLMLLVIFTMLDRWRRSLVWSHDRFWSLLCTFVVLYGVAYPATLAIWQSYRDPYAYLGRHLAVRSADYGEMSRTLASYAPQEAVVISDMAHELNWLNGNRTILFPSTSRDLQLLVGKYDVTALYEHPLFPRDWEWLPDHFRLVDDRNGRLWIRQHEAGRP